MVKYGYMISFDSFKKALESGQINRLDFMYEAKEYVIAREVDEETSVPSFVFAGENFEPIVYESARELSKSVTVGEFSLRDVWNFITPICNDTLADDDYIEIVYGDTLGKIMNDEEGTASTHDRYVMQNLLPSVVVCAAALIILAFCTFFIDSLSWAFFGASCGVIAAAFLIAQIIFISNTRQYRQGNPRAHCYLLYRGMIIVTDRFEYAIPYEKIIRLDTEAGIQIVTLKTVFTFTPSHGEEITESLKSIFEEVKAIKKKLYKKKD